MFRTIWRTRSPQQPRLPAWLPSTAILLAALGGAAACSRSQHPAPGQSGHGLTVWAHHGKPEEWATIQEQVKRFNAAHPEHPATLVEIAEAGYDTQVQSAAASGELPDVLEFDGPMLASYVWKGYLAPLPDTPPALLQDLLPSILKQGTYQGKLYAFGLFDSGLGLFADRSLLQEAGARIPSGPGDAWTIAEFDALLASLAAREKRAGGDGQVLDLKRDYRGEWWTYGFYPCLVSAGADLIDRESYASAEHVLNSPRAVDALTHIQRWFKDGFVDPNADGRAFVDGRAAISWTGHWEFPRYRQALGERLVLLPLPDFGNGSHTAMGSWVFGITRACRRPEAALAFIEFLLQPREIEATAAANGAVPARQSVIAQSPDYGKGGPLELYARQLKETAVPRPVTPAYPVITSVFQEAMTDIIEGADVKRVLDDAARKIDQDIQDNEGYANQSDSRRRSQ